MTVVLMIMMGFHIATRDINPYLNKARGSWTENKHSTDVESPPPPPRVCMSIQYEGEPFSDLGQSAYSQ